MNRVVASTVAGLASILIGVSDAQAQGGGAAQGQSVIVTFATPPTRTITVVTLGATGVVSTAKPGPTPGTFVLPARDFATGKAVEIWTIRCQDTRQVGVIDPLVALPANCTKSRDLGKGTWTPGASLAAAFPPPPGGIRLSPYALGGVNFTYTTNLGGVEDTLNDAFNQAGFDAFSNETSALDFGWQFGGGMRLSWSRKFPAIDVSYVYSNVGGPSLISAATIAEDSVIGEFDMESSLAYRLSSLRFGAKFKLGPVHVTPMVAINWWKVRLNTDVAFTIDGNPIASESLNLDWSDNDWGFGARVDYKLPALRKLAPLSIYGEVMLNRIRGENDEIFGDEQLPPWPPQHKLIVMAVGVKYSFRGFRIGGNVQ